MADLANCQVDVVVGYEYRGKKVVGKPYAGEPHVRFEVAGAGDGSARYRARARPYKWMWQ